MKTKGSKTKKRFVKTRSDKNKKRKFYAGKKTKHRRKSGDTFVRYIPKRRRDDAIKLEFWSVEKMSSESLMHFSQASRRKMHRYIYHKNSLRIDVNPSEISTKEKIEELALSYLWAIPDGYWLIMFRSHAKNQHHNSPKAFGTVKITDHKEGMKAKVVPHYKKRSLKRMFFWRDD